MIQRSLFNGNISFERLESVHLYTVSQVYVPVNIQVLWHCVLCIVFYCQMITDLQHTVEQLKGEIER